MALPLVSVCVITYNHEPYIAQCLDGILMQQTSFPFEIVVGEDCSTDGTRTIVEAYAAKYPHLIRPVYHATNVGGARNAYEFCYPLLRAQYVAACEGDDYWTDPLKLQKQVDFMEQNKGYSLCFHQVDKVNAKGEVIVKRIPENKMVHYSSDAVFHINAATPSLLFRNCINAIPKEIFQVACGDIFLKAMLASMGNGADLRFVGAAYRIHPGGVYSAKPKIEKVTASLKSRRRMLMSDFFTPAQKKAIKSDLVTRKKQYLLFFLKKRQFRNFIKVLLY